MTIKKSKSRRSKRKKNNKNKFLRLRYIALIVFVLTFFSLFHLGFIGILIANISKILFGDIYELLLCCIFLWSLYVLIFNKNINFSNRRYLGLILILLGLMFYLDILFFNRLNIHSHFIKMEWLYLNNFSFNILKENIGGGIIITILYSILYFLVSSIGVYFVSSVLLLNGICLLLSISFSKILIYIKKLINYVNFISKKIFGFFKIVFSKLIYEITFDKVSKKLVDNQDSILTNNSSNDLKNINLDNENIYTNLKKDMNNNGLKDIILSSSDTIDDSNNTNDSNNTKIFNDNNNEKDSKIFDHNKNINISDNKFNISYKLPNVDILKDIKSNDQSDERRIIKKNQLVLSQTLKSFGVRAKLEKTILGPSVTKYELRPDIGVKVSKIVNLSDDLALALAAKDIRIEAPIPGKSLIGLEVPNKNVATVSFKDIIYSEQREHHNLLEVPLGRDISGNLITMDIVNTPHILIAGATGSGKSVAINVIITSILMNCMPGDVKLMLIDPKKVELGVYNGIPHLLTPVIVDSKKATLSLEKLVHEMERRYEIFSELGVRNINGYNTKKDIVNYHKLPYIVCIIDELADLMLLSSKEVESFIIRIAQMGRAAGIHLIIATQRPSVDIITGVIKANIPSRIAFAVSSGTDSRTILDQNGAEKLLGKGDMLFKMVGKKPIRVQGAYISDSDVINIVSFIRKESNVNYDSNFDITSVDLTSKLNSKEDSIDPLFKDVVDFIRSEQKVSISLLQRHFNIGYNRSAKIVDILYHKNMIGPQKGSKPREVFLEKKDNLNK